MNQTSKYYDRRSSFFREYFEKGLPFPDYIASGDSGQQARWKEYAMRIKPGDSQYKLLLSFKRRINVLVLSGIWCGDCARQGPMLRAIEEAAPTITVHFVESRANPELQDELRILGATRVPVVVALSEDFFEVSRFGDRTLGAYRHKAEAEFGPACDAGLGNQSPPELAEELAEWVAHFERIQLMLRLAPALRERYQD